MYIFQIPKGISLLGISCLSHIFYFLSCAKNKYGNLLNKCCIRDPKTHSSMNVGLMAS